jgi:hypothetical protein
MRKSKWWRKLIKMNNKTSLRKEMQDIFDNIESGLHHHDEKMMRAAIVTGERLLPCLSWKPSIAQFYSKLGNAYSDWFQPQIVN